MKKINLLFLCISLKSLAFSQASLPVPDHIVIVIMENHGYSRIIDSSYAPYIRQLAFGAHSALFTQSFAITHPSQPNYIDFYSGCNQGVTNDSFPATSPFATENLGSQLIAAGRSFATYSEDLPYVGYNGITSGKYARKHNPAANWMGTDTYQIPETTNQPLPAFPFTDFSQLPTVAYVIPNQDNDMHNGTDPTKITRGDTWLNENLDAYIQWADTSNSLFILTFDEDEYAAGNHITTILSGQSVLAGQYNEVINHYTVLRTIEQMYELPYACEANSAIAITDCWKMISGTDQIAGDDFKYTIYPIPAHMFLTIDLTESQGQSGRTLSIYSILGKKEIELNLGSCHNVIPVDQFAPGLYIYQLAGSPHSLKTGMLLIQ